MSQLPPPTRPPAGQEGHGEVSGEGRSGPGAGGGSGGATSSFDWDRLRELADRWFRPLIEPQGWLALLYLVASALIAGLAFAALVLLGSLTVGLLFVVVGVFLVVPTFMAVERLVAVERWLASAAGLPVDVRQVAPVDGIGPRAALTALGDPVRWRQVAFLVCNVVIAPFLLTVGAFPVTVALQILGGDPLFDGPWFNLGDPGLLALPVAAVVAGLVPRMARWTAEVKARIATWFLGTDRLAAAQERVTVLSGQRQDILDAVATERRRIERNLHDGVQQQLVAIGLDLGMAARHVDDDPALARELIDSARDKVQGSIGELRQLGRGLHPAILADRGLDAALSAVVSSSPIPITVRVEPGLDLSTDVAEVLYFVANEALANVLKHARARAASIHVTQVAANVRLVVHDDGVGGADPSAGSGLAGIRARVNAVDGVFSVTSAPGGPTTLVVEVPRHA